MNIIEIVRETLISFPKISEVCNNIHVDFTDKSPTNYGLSPTGDKLIKTDILGNQTREHTFTLYAIYQSLSDYDRLANSGIILELQMWLENHTERKELSVLIDDKEYIGKLEKLTCSNGMLYNIPNGNLTSGVCYQLQITARYKIL